MNSYTEYQSINDPSTGGYSYGSNPSATGSESSTTMGMSNGGLTTLIQTALITAFGSGASNPLNNMIIASIIMSVIPSATKFLAEIIKSIMKFFEAWTYKLYYKIVDRFFKNKNFTKYVEISYITDDKKINELYKAVNWYITNCEEIDYLKETPIKFTYENDLSKYKKSSSVKINKIIAKNKEKEIIYKNSKIKYSFDNELITIYTDRDRKRENYKVTLSTEMNTHTHHDIIEKFCEFCLHEYFKNMTSSVWEQQIYVNKDGKWTSSKSNNYRKLDTIILKDNLINEIKNDVTLFVNSEEWYKSRDIPYKRGYLFYGTPGTGKTSVIKGISNSLKKHIHYLILNNIKSDLELIELLKNIEYNKTIIVIEDIDCMLDSVKSRELIDKNKNDENNKNNENDTNNTSNTNNTNKKQKGQKNKRNQKKSDNDDDRDDDRDDDKAEQSKITLSGILNGIDGIFNQDGRILIMTTNKPEILDEALLRPGRIDKCYLFDHCVKAQIKDLYEMFYQKPCPENQLEKIKDHKYSPAHMTAVFMRYRDDPENALINIDKVSHNIRIDTLIEQRNEVKSNSLYFGNSGIDINFNN
jgi:SpoVK/Ycf46/Vps4 family AAA+-type ATPase